jgi:hypothetical protein
MELRLALLVLRLWDVLHVPLLDVQLVPLLNCLRSVELLVSPQQPIAPLSLELTRPNARLVTQDSWLMPWESVSPVPRSSDARLVRMLEFVLLVPLHRLLRLEERLVLILLLVVQLFQVLTKPNVQLAILDSM